MKILFLTNLPTPYRIDFYNSIAQYCQLTVIFEGRRFEQQKFNWLDESLFNFEYHFAEELLNERKIKWRIIFHVLRKKYERIIVGCYHTRTQSVLIFLMRFLGRKYIFETDGGMIPAQECLVRGLLKKMMISGAFIYLSPSSNTDKYLVHYGASLEKVHRYPFTSIKESDIISTPLTEIEKRNLRNKLGINTSYLILSVGQFIHRKGFDILLKAMSDVHIDTTLCIIGGIQTDEYKSIIERMQIKNVLFLPFLSKEELMKYYKASDIFVLPTREDIWGLVINEAMAQALPIITTDKCVAGLELVNKRFITPAESVERLSQVINSLFNDVTLRETAAKENWELIQYYTIENMAKVIFNIIK